MLKHIPLIEKHFFGLLDHPQPERLSRGLRLVRAILELGFHVWNFARRERLPLLASALTYRTFFGLVPVIVLALVIFKAFGDMDSLEKNTIQRVDSFLATQQNTDDTQGAEKLDINNGASEDTSKAILPTTTENDQSQLDTSAKQQGSSALSEALLTNTSQDAEQQRQGVSSLIRALFKNAKSVDMKTVGTIGILVLFWAAIALMVEIENIFNILTQVSRGRSWLTRILVYWFTLTVGPLLIYTSVYINNTLFDSFKNTPGLHILFSVINTFMAFIVTWIFFSFLYMTMPNRRMMFRSVMIGSFFAAVGIEVLKGGMQYFLSTAFISPTHAALYGSLALIPVLLFWIYMLWLITLSGLLLIQIVQSLPQLRKDRRSEMARRAWVQAIAHGTLALPAMACVMYDFRNGKKTTLDSLTSQLDAPADTMSGVMIRLQDAGWIHDAGDIDQQNAWTLAKPAQDIKLRDIVSLSPPPHERLPGAQWLADTRQAQINAIDNLTLNDLPQNSPSDDADPSSQDA